MTYADIFFSTLDTPRLEALKSVKAFAKQNVGRPDSHLPHEISRLMYLLSILVAEMQEGERITRLRTQALREQVVWALKQDWIDGESRRILKSAQEQLAEATQRDAGAGRSR